MYKGKRIKKITHMSKRAALLVLSLVTILTVSVSGTLAYLIRSTAPAENTFIPGTIDTSTTEDFKDNAKTNVYVQNGKNKGTLPVYVRAKVVFAWTDGAGNVLADPVLLNTDKTVPAGAANVNVTWGSPDAWKEGTDGFYYYSEVLMPGASTSDLIDSCSPVADTSPVGAKLQVTIMTQSIQAYQSEEADKQIKAAWGADAQELLPPPYTGTLSTTTSTPAGGTN